MLKIGKQPEDPNYDLILIAFKTNQVESLSEKLREELNRWDYTDNILRTYQDAKTVRGFIMEKFGVSMATAYRDVKNAKRFFGSINITDKDFYRQLYAESLEELHKLSIAKGDYKTAALALKEAAEIRCLKESDDIQQLYSDLEASKFVITINVTSGDSDKPKVTEIDLDKIDSADEAVWSYVDESIRSADSVSEAQMIKLLKERNDG